MTKEATRGEIQELCCDLLERCSGEGQRRGIDVFVHFDMDGFRTLLNKATDDSGPLLQRNPTTQDGVRLLRVHLNELVEAAGGHHLHLGVAADQTLVAI